MGANDDTAGAVAAAGLCERQRLGLPSEETAAFLKVITCELHRIRTQGKVVRQSAKIVNGRMLLAKGKPGSQIPGFVFVTCKEILGWLCVEVPIRPVRHRAHNVRYAKNVTTLTFWIILQFYGTGFVKVLFYCFSFEREQFAAGPTVLLLRLSHATNLRTRQTLHASTRDRDYSRIVLPRQ